MSPDVLYACAGHVLVDIPIFGGPVVVLGGWLTWTTLRSRREGGEETG
jgi:hypothetical protein